MYNYNGTVNSIFQSIRTLLSYKCIINIISHCPIYVHHLHFKYSVLEPGIILVGGVVEGHINSVNSKRSFGKSEVVMR